MPRNLDRRVEVLVAGLPRRAPARLQEILDVSLADDTLAWELGPDARGTRVPTEQGIDSQAQLYELARRRSRTGSSVTTR